MGKRADLLKLYEKRLERAKATRDELDREDRELAALSEEIARTPEDAPSDPEEREPTEEELRAERRRAFRASVASEMETRYGDPATLNTAARFELHVGVLFDRVADLYGIVEDLRDRAEPVIARVRRTGFVGG